MLDTNICIYIIKQKPEKVLNHLQEHDIAEIAISSITLSELEYGAMKSMRTDQNRFAIIQFTAAIDVLPYDDIAARHYGEVRSYLEKKGTPIGNLDMLIAAHALSRNCILVTNNEKEFKRVPNLKIENWV
ncbi:MAG: type II toxin-antitoxin system VapC family toxin [Desulfamplus sp.]|nr:type II toxin-antitoxin system VapC family toxin [Desulfamplus sp.]